MSADGGKQFSFGDFLAGARCPETVEERVQPGQWRTAKLPRPVKLTVPGIDPQRVIVQGLELWGRPG